MKDSEGDTSCIDNYRGLTLSHIFSFMFEHAMLLKFGHFLYTDNLQFGYKSKHSTSHAIYVMKTCIEYFTKHGSRVLVSFLDCSKGFDRVNHHGIFLKLMARSVPLCFLSVIVYWYSNLMSKCKWGDSFSHSFHVPSGVRQGGVLSPKIFNGYMDDLVEELRLTGVGCHIIDYFVAAILYADDLCLLAPSRQSMQLLLDICQSYADRWCIRYNAKKTKCMIFGKDHDKVDMKSLVLDNNGISFVNQYKYLGVIVQSSKNFSCDPKPSLCSFYRSVNTILNVARGPSESVQMKLLYSICVPVLTYACEVKVFSAREVIQMNTALNDAIRKIFGFNRWESVQNLRIELSYPSDMEIFHGRTKSFLRMLPLLQNDVLTFLHRSSV